jgi:hypothetical protein
MPLIVVEAAHQQRQLRAEMSCEPEREPVPQGAQDRPKDVPGHLPIRPYFLGKLLEPQIGRLQGLVEDV